MIKPINLIKILNSNNNTIKTTIKQKSNNKNDNYN